MPQNYKYYLAYAVGVAVLALFYRSRRRGVSRHVAVVCAILAVIGALLIVAAMLV